MFVDKNLYFKSNEKGEKSDAEDPIKKSQKNLHTDIIKALNIFFTEPL